MAERSLLARKEEIMEALKQKQYGQAEKLVKDTEDLLALGTERGAETLLLVLPALASYYRHIQNYDRSANLFQQALHTGKQAAARHSKNWAEIHFEYAALERQYGHHASARKLLATLLQFLEKREEKDTVSIGRVYSTLGKIAMDEENYQQAASQLRQAVSLFRQSLPETHSLLLQTIDLLSNTFIQMESYQQARDLYQERLKKHREAGNHLLTGKTLLKMGEIDFYLNLRQARKTTGEALSVLEHAVGEKNIEISRAHLLLGELEENMGKFPRAVKHYKYALEQLEHFYEPEHFMVVFAYAKIGTLAMKANDLEEAKTYLEKGLPLSQAFPKVRLQFLYALGKLYSGEELYEKADSFYEDFLQQLQTDDRKQSKAYADTLQALAFNALKQNDTEKAGLDYQKALDIYQQLKTRTFAEEGLCRIRLAYCVGQQDEQDVARAAANYEKGFRLLERTRDPALMEEALAGIIDFFTRHPDSKKRRKYEDKFVKLQTGKRQ